jgi:hypothetical protein
LMEYCMIDLTLNPEPANINPILMAHVIFLNGYHKSKPKYYTSNSFLTQPQFLYTPFHKKTDS